MNSIEVSSLVKNYGSLRAVDNVNLSIKQGEIFGMLGPNGAGKTTTMEILVGLRRPDSGSVSVLGLSPTTQKGKLQQRIGVQLQTPSLFPRLTVRESLQLNASFYDNPFPVDEVLGWIGLQDRVKILTNKLSGGQLQRLAVGAAMIGNGDIIFLDEPTTGLDPQARRNMWDVMVHLRKLNKTVFLTTHYMEEAERLCDRLAIIDHGSIIALDSPDELIRHHFQEQAIDLNLTNSDDADAYKHAPGVNRVQVAADKITLYSGQVEETIRYLIGQEVAGGPALAGLSIRKASLEDVFLKLTGRSMRE